MDRPSIVARYRTVKTALLLAAWLLSGCGSKDPTAPLAPAPAPPESTRQAGTVAVANHTAYDLEVAYLNETDPDAPRIVRTHVPAGQRAEVSGGVLPAGLAVEFDLVLVPTPGRRNSGAAQKSGSRLDGDWVLNVRLADESDPFSLEVASASP